MPKQTCENSTKARANIEAKQFIEIKIYYLKEICLYEISKAK